MEALCSSVELVGGWISLLDDQVARHPWLWGTLELLDLKVSLSLGLGLKRWTFQSPLWEVWFSDWLSGSREEEGPRELPVQYNIFKPCALLQPFSLPGIFESGASNLTSPAPGSCLNTYDRGGDLGVCCVHRLWAYVHLNAQPPCSTIPASSHSWAFRCHGLHSHFCSPLQNLASSFLCSLKPTYHSPPTLHFWKLFWCLWRWLWYLSCSDVFILSFSLHTGVLSAWNPCLFLHFTVTSSESRSWVSIFSLLYCPLASLGCRLYLLSLFTQILAPAWYLLVEWINKAELGCSRLEEVWRFPSAWPGGSCHQKHPTLPLKSQIWDHILLYERVKLGSMQRGRWCLLLTPPHLCSSCDDLSPVPFGEKCVDQCSGVETWFIMLIMTAHIYWASPMCRAPYCVCNMHNLI